MFYGDKFRTIRIKKGMSLNDAAIALGKHRKTLWGWEKGRTSPSTLNVKALADLLGVDIAEISDLDAALPKSENEERAYGQSEKDFEYLDEKDRAYIRKLQNSLLKANMELQHIKDQTVGYNSTFDGMRALVYTKNKKLSFTSINKPYLELLKKDRSSIIGKTSFAAFSLDEAIVVDQQEKQVLEGKRVHGVEIAVPGSRKTKGCFLDSR